MRIWAIGCSVLFCVCLLIGCGGGEDPPATDRKTNADATNGSTKVPKRIDPSTLPVPEVKTGICRIYTPQPGFLVLVDGRLVRDEESGKWLATPCAVTLPVGNHDIKVAKQGFRDTPLTGRLAVTEEKEAEAFLEPEKDPLGIAESVLDAPYLQAEVGKPIALESLNSPGLETDPYVTPDGLAIYFAADRSEGNGIYFATRTSPYVEFYPPQLLQTSRGREGKATPSITADGRIVTFAMPKKQRIIALERDSPLGDYTDKHNLKFSSRSSELWLTAQMLRDGLRFYWTVQTDGKIETRVASRKSLDSQFGPTRRVSFPGDHPCLSSNGLRQYVFDGKTVRRARRASVTSEFSRLETIAEVSLENYVPSKERRQFFVSDDEQWLYYCNDPGGEGDLYLVRLSSGANWGFAASGKNIPPKTLVATNPTPDKPGSSPTTSTNTTPKIDPRTLPLPYTTYWKKFNTLMQSQQYSDAKQLVEESQSDARFAKDSELLGWDAEDVRRITGFWNDVRRSLTQMKPGDPLRFGAAKVSLLKFENDQITAKARTKEISKPIQEMSPVDLLAITDIVVAKTDQEGQARMGSYLHYDPKGGASSARTRFERAGELGEQFYERLAARVLHQAQQEFERDKIAAGLGFVSKVMADFPESKAAAGAIQLELKAYEFTKWQQRGQWQAGSSGEFTAANGRTENTYLVSPKAYDNFELRLEWKTVANGSGGVFFRYRGSGDPNLFGYKVQLADDFGSGRVDPQTTGALFNESAPIRNAVRKRGEWNSLRMQVRGTKVMVEINGKKVLDQEAEVSNFKAISGIVMLDGVPGGITYRKTLLIELPPAK